MSFGFFVKVLSVTKLRKKVLGTEFEILCCFATQPKNELLHKNKVFIKLSHHPLGPQL